jgi:hypothetical protein
MVPPREAPMGQRDRRVVGIARDPKDDVGVALDRIEHRGFPEPAAPRALRLRGL